MDTRPTREEIRSDKELLGYKYEYPNDHPFGQGQYRVAVECATCPSWFEAWDDTPDGAQQRAALGMLGSGGCKSCSWIHTHWGLGRSWLVVK